MIHQANVRYSNGFTIVELLIVVVVIAILAAITIVAYNGVTNQAKNSARAAELASLKRKSEVYKVQNNIECPNNYVFVYGNSVLGTSDFCVMKYEAKNVGGVATSQASGIPWATISQTNAISTATAAGGHLLTGAEWMTIAADVLSVKYNWSGGEVGSGLLYQGHIGANPASALAASTNDDDVLFGMTGNLGTTTGTNSNRVLYLKSGDAIWDFSGNLWEWTAPAQAMSQVGVSGESGWNWRQWNYGSLNLGNLPTSWRPSTLATIPGLEAITSWDGTKGIGQIYANYNDTGTRAPIRGGFWNGGVGGGILQLDLSASPSNTYASTGFRVAR